MEGELYVYVFGFSLVFVNLGLNIFNMVANKQVKEHIKYNKLPIVIKRSVSSFDVGTEMTKVEEKVECEEVKETSSESTDDTEIEIVIPEETKEESKIEKKAGYFTTWFNTE